MSKSELKDLLTVTDLCITRKLAKMPCATEQGIRSQIRAVDNGEKTEQQVGFQIVRVSESMVLLRLLDKDLENFRKRMLEYAKANPPGKKQE